MKKFGLYVATNADDRHWENESGDCYRLVATVDATSWKKAFGAFQKRYPSIMALFGTDARVSIATVKN